MDNTVKAVEQGEGGGLGRRSLLLGLGAAAFATASATAGLAEDVLASDVSRSSTNPLSPLDVPASEISYRESALGIDYRDLAPSPLAEMLSQGEAEWMANAQAKYGEKTQRYWEKALLPSLFKGTPSESAVDRLREFTPGMLLNFAQLDGNDPKYGLLAAYGSSFLSARILANA